MSAIRAEGLTKRYGETLALDALDLRVEPGEVYGYLGPNGEKRPAQNNREPRGG